ncbi:tyrosine-protein phosphatase [Tessaracoccus flavus]|uniref:Uncharacterized protein n=1 Tax=Tessaracoccus flavus TaxID=1610493 RepID=A0A1Q2CEN7_9ACTN|nr:tyrosine-protein phosphatase [Tessaracoccus flavus]AQP44568.1 hypothetical protein RPIT_06865 [Tessaracoccus flavus]SDZ09567.1 Tyrosine phosphatase family protein [Tessaracoccus flavus]
MGINWDGAVNARRVNDTVVRMARREWVSPRGWDAAIADGFTTVVDLRSPYEWQTVRDGDWPMPPDLQRRLRLISAPTEDPEHPRFQELLAPYLDHPAHYPTYLELFGDKVAKALMALAEAPAGVIVHCSAGRDRTGLVVALGQKLAGWPDDEIVAGYIAAAEGINELHRTNPHPRERYLTGVDWRRWIDGRHSALEGFLARLNAPGLLSDAGLSAADLDLIRLRFRMSNA